MKTVTMKNASDAFVNSNKPKKNYSNTARMQLQDGALGFIFFGNPTPRRAKVMSATLRVWSGGSWPGNNQLKVRRVSEKWNVNRVTWDNKPDIAGSVVTVSKTNPSDGTEWEFDVTNIIQNVADGSAWWGFRLDVDASTKRWIHSTQSNNVNRRPRLEITWSENPFAPTDLSPSDGGIVSLAKPILRFDFFDVAGNKTMASYQVQINPTSSFVSPQFDTGAVATDEPECDLSLTSYSGLSAGSTTYWRVRVRDGSGLWSSWSDAESFKRVGKGTLTMTNPITYVEESTPPIAWTFSGTQERYQVTLIDPVNLKVMWDTGRVTSTDNAVTLPKKKLRKPGKTYRIRLRVWDAINREGTPGDPPWIAITREFEYTPTLSVTGTTSLTVLKSTEVPFTTLRWSSSTMPDGFTIMRDEEVIEVIDEPEDLVLSGTTYQWRDYQASGRKEHTWEVARVVNGRQSKKNSLASAYVKNITCWLMEKDGSNAVSFFNSEVKLGLSEDSEVMFPRGGPPVLITQSFWGYVGTATGLITSLDGTSNDLFRTRYLRLRESRSEPLVLLWADEAIECYIYNSEIDPKPRPDGTTDYIISFQFVQQDYS